MTDLPCPYSRLWLVSIPEDGWDRFECIVDDGHAEEPKNGVEFQKTHIPDNPTVTIHTAVLDEITNKARQLSEKNIALKKELRNKEAEMDARIRTANDLYRMIGVAAELLRRYRKGVDAVLNHPDTPHAEKVKAMAILNEIDSFTECL